MRRLLSGLFLCLALSTAAAAQDARARLMQLHDDLRLTADQEGAWSLYADTAARGEEAQARHQAAETLLPQLPAPRRLALLEAAMTQDLADFHRQSLAVTTLYDHLSPSQQRIFDRETLPSGGDAPAGGGLRAPPPP